MTELRDVRLGSPPCAYELRRATEAAARAAKAGPAASGQACDVRAARMALEAELAAQGVNGRVVAGDGQRFGDPTRLPVWDVLLDPTEGGGCLAPGLTNAMACLALAPAGTLFDPGPAFYMEKLVAPPQARGRLDPAAPVEERLAALAACLGKSVTHLTVYVLEKPRHRRLVERIQAQGARVALVPAGDVPGGGRAAPPHAGSDAVMGPGGLGEGVLAACPAKARGDGVERGAGHERTQSLLAGGGAGDRQMLTCWHRLEG